MIRTFIAAEINPETREELTRELAHLRKLAPAVKWSHPENLHLTFKFLGDVAEDDLDELFAALGGLPARVEPFVVEVTGLGAFPNLRNPRVVWAGCAQGAEEAAACAGEIEAICYDLGYAPEARPFTPHLTLGRVKLPADAYGLERAIEGARGRNFGFIDVDEICVFMSDLRRTGPVYAPMHRIRL